MFPQDFYFTQAKLEDYLTCRRRFYWRYILELPCPAQVAEPAQDFERAYRNGAIFHQAVRQLMSGIPVEKVVAVIRDPDVRLWLDRFLQHIYPLIHPMGEEMRSRHEACEVLAAISFSGYRLLAKYDFISITEEGKAQIWDWKTSSTLPAFHTLEKRMQSVVYPLVLALGGYKTAVAPEDIEMRYWFANFPLEVMRIPYSQDQLKRDTELLSHLLREITTAQEDYFVMTPDERICRLCVYRSLCARGRKAGRYTDEDIESFEKEWEAELDFDQILEVEF